MNIVVLGMDSIFKELDRLTGVEQNDDNGDTTHDDGAYEPENLPTFEPEEVDIY